jgi:hypothetical protein
MHGMATGSDRRQEPGRDRQAGGHWFEPSTAHPTKGPEFGAFLLSEVGRVAAACLKNPCGQATNIPRAE